MKLLMTILNLFAFHIALADSTWQDDSKFDGTKFVGVYISTDPLGCRNGHGVYVKYRIKISFNSSDRNNSSGSVLISTTDGEGVNSRWQDFINIKNINLGSYISSNSCFSDGLIFRSTTTATDKHIKTKVEQLDHNWFCEPTDRVI